MLSADFVVVGSGLSGATVARTLHDAGREVLVLERRPIIGGNVADTTHKPSGIRYSLHGPHFFRTSCPRIWDYVTRFGAFTEYQHRILSLIDGELVPWPVQRKWIRKVAGEDWKPEFTGTPSNFEEAALSMMPRAVYDRAVRPYNEKMWNRPAHELSASLCKRFDVRDGETRLTPNAKYQGLPKHGYSTWMKSMLDGIEVMRGYDYLRYRENVRAKKLLVFTGSIDSFFGYKLGRLQYRSQRREHEYYPDRECVQPVAQVNTPQHESGKHIRRIEWRHLQPFREELRGTLLTREYPFTPTNEDQLEYPMQDAENQRLYQAYRELAKVEPKTVFIGRLARYVYLDMDGAISAALKCVEKIMA